MARPQSRFVCQSCGDSTLRWEGQCRGCGAWNTLVETLVRESASGARSRSVATADVAPIPLREIGGSTPLRMALGMGEVDRVVGGGLVPGSVILLGGEPGIGKSTLVMQLAAGIARGGSGCEVLYVSGEESAAQIRLRADRLGLPASVAGERISILAETAVERMIAAAERASPDLMIVDSVQTSTADGLDGPAGSVGQVRQVAAVLADFARRCDVPVLLVGHVTKEGTLAGPRTLEHLVDAVLSLEGDRSGSLRLLRAFKNRFGSTEEIGVLEMGEMGLREVVDPARAFLTAGELGASGVAVAATLEGARPLLVEVQALVAPQTFGTPRRTVRGVDGNRLALLVAVLGRRAGVQLAAQDIYASLAGGLSVDEPAVDLPLALALASSARDRALLPGTVACGEIGLLGELRPVRGLDRRLGEAVRLGFRRAIVPAERMGGSSAAPRVDIELQPAATLREALAVAFEPDGSPGAGARTERTPAHR